MAVAAKIDRDGFFQECQRQGEDPAKMVMAYYLKYVQEKQQYEQQQWQQQYEQQQQQQRQGQQQLEPKQEEAEPMDAQNAPVGKKKTSEEDRMKTFLGKPTPEFRVRIGDMKQERNRQKKVDAAIRKNLGQEGAENDVEADMKEFMREGEKILNDIQSCHNFDRLVNVSHSISIIASLSLDSIMPLQ